MSMVHYTLFWVQYDSHYLSQYLNEIESYQALLNLAGSTARRIEDDDGNETRFHIYYRIHL